jgi:hypothetical protein
MVDLDPKIWENPTLGDAATNGFIDEMEAQAIENAAAKREGRQPLIARRLHRYPGASNDVNIDSSYDSGMRWYNSWELPETDPDYAPRSNEFSEVEPQAAPVNNGAYGAAMDPDFLFEEHPANED